MVPDRISDTATPSWVSVAFVNVTGPVEQLPVVAVAPPATATKGAVAAATKAPAVASRTATIAVPAAKGVIGFISFDTGQNSYVLNNAVVTAGGRDFRFQDAGHGAGGISV